MNKVDGTSKWIIKNKLVQDIILTSDIEDWLNHAVKSKFINQTVIAKHKLEILNFIQIKDKSEYSIKEDDKIGDVISKIEGMTNELRK